MEFISEGSTASSSYTPSQDSFDTLLREAACVQPISVPIAEEETLLGGRFELRKRLGEGGMGVVYEALDREHDAVLALKSLNRLSPGSICRLKKEFRALCGLAHRNLVGIHELFSDSGRWFFTMDLVKGVGFVQHVRGADAPSSRWRKVGLRTGCQIHAASMSTVQEDRLRDALVQLVTGVAAIHDSGKLHCDLKPSNVMVTEQGRVVILDFGLVKERRTGPRERTTDGHAAGTPAYMSPEQAGGARAVPASDWYSVGVMLYEALTGRLPFEGSSLRILQKKYESDPVPPSIWTAGLPVDLDRLCVELLQRDPKRRPNAAEILAWLDRRPDQQSTANAVGLSPAPPTAFVGREEHLAVLERAFRTTRQGKPQAVFVHGSSGMGKTALASHFVDTIVRENRAVVLAGACYEREAVPFKAFDGIVDELSRLLRHLSAEEAAQLLPRDIHSLALMFPVLKTVNTVANAGGRDGQTSDRVLLRQRAFGALKELLVRMTDRWPVVLLIDDLQWSDVDSARLLEELVEGPEPPNLLLIGCYRREEVSSSTFLRQTLSVPRIAPPATGAPDAGKGDKERQKVRAGDGHSLRREAVSARFRWLSSSHASAGPALNGSEKRGSQGHSLRHLMDIEELAVDQLSFEEAKTLAIELLGPGDTNAEPIAESIARESDGVPFYVCELVQHVAGGRERPDSGSLGETVSLRRILSERLVAVSDRARRLLEVIAVAGRPIDQKVALTAAGSHPRHRGLIRELRLANLVRTRGSAAVDAVEVYHEKVRDMALQSLSADRLRRCHRRLALALEATGTASADWLAEHFRGAGMSKKAGQYAVAAANRARGVLAFGRASELYRWALALFQVDEADNVRRGGMFGLFSGSLLGLVMTLAYASSFYFEAAISAQIGIPLGGLIGGGAVGMIAGSVASLLRTRGPEEQVADEFAPSSQRLSAVCEPSRDETS